MRRTVLASKLFSAVVAAVLLSVTVGTGSAWGARKTGSGATTTTTVVAGGFTMPRSLSLVSTNPWASAQSTAWGKRLGKVSYLNGEVHVGYGDWGANTGPIHVTSWSPTTGNWTDHITADTEAIENIKVIGDRAYVPMIDPRSNTADLATSGPATSGPWAQIAAGSSGGAAFEHVFDVAETADGLWMVGSKRGVQAAMVMRSTDGGTTWQESLVVPGAANRFYSATVLDGVLHVQDQYGAYQFANGSWTSAPLTASTHLFHDAVSVPGSVAAIGYYGPGWLYVFDGTTSRTSTTSDWLSLTTYGGKVYALRSGRVVSSTDLVNWQTVTRKVPTGATSLAVGGGYLWFGTSSSGLWAAPLS